MKNFFTYTFCIVILIGCKKETSLKGNEIQDKFAFFGDSISQYKAISSDQMMTQFDNMKVGDTLNLKFKSKIKSVCQKKGCWMTLELQDKKEVFVKFKNYAFFVPKNAKDEEVIVNGKAFISIESVAELRHYAKDAGKSQVEIDSIVKPKTTYSFMANGLLIKR